MLLKDEKEFSSIRAFFIKRRKIVFEKRTNNKKVLDERTVWGILITERTPLAWRGLSMKAKKERQGVLEERYPL